VTEFKVTKTLCEFLFVDNGCYTDTVGSSFWVQSAVQTGDRWRKFTAAGGLPEENSLWSCGPLLWRYNLSGAQTLLKMLHDTCNGREDLCYIFPKSKKLQNRSLLRAERYLMHCVWGPWVRGPPALHDRQRRLYRPVRMAVSLIHRRTSGADHWRLTEQLITTSWSSVWIHLSLHWTPTDWGTVEQSAGSTSAPAGTATGGHWTGIVCDWMVIAETAIAHYRRLHYTAKYFNKTVWHCTTLLFINEINLTVYNIL